MSKIPNKVIKCSHAKRIYDNQPKIEHIKPIITEIETPEQMKLNIQDVINTAETKKNVEQFKAFVVSPAPTQEQPQQKPIIKRSRVIRAVKTTEENNVVYPDVSKKRGNK